MFSVGICLIILLFGTVDLRDMKDKLMERPLPELLYYIALLLVLQVTSMVLSAVKWRIVLRNSAVSMKNIIPATFVGHLLNNITPVGLAGGEPIRAYILYKKEKISMSIAASSVIVDLFLEIFPLFFLIILSLLVVITSGISLEVAAALLVILFALIVLFIVAVSLVYHKKYSLVFIKVIIEAVDRLPFFKRYSPRMRNNVDVIVDKFNKAMRLHMLDKEIIVMGTTVSMCNWILRVMRLYLSFIALGITVQLDTVLIVEIVVSTIAFLPLLPGALGIWEWSSVELFGILDSSILREYATMGTMLNRMFFYLVPCIIGAISAVYLGIRTLQITKTTDKEQIKELRE